MTTKPCVEETLVRCCFYSDYTMLFGDHPSKIYIWGRAVDYFVAGLFESSSVEKYTSSSTGLVSPPTAALKNAPPLQLHQPVSVYKFLELLHWESTDRLACWLRLEDAGLLREGVHTLASWPGGFLLELHVPNASFSHYGF